MRLIISLLLASVATAPLHAGFREMLDKAKEKASAVKGKVEQVGKTTVSLVKKDLDLAGDVAQGRKGPLSAARQSVEAKLQATKDFFKKPRPSKFRVVPNATPVKTIAMEPPLSPADFKAKQSTAYYFMGSVMQPGAPLLAQAQEALFDESKHEDFAKQVILRYQTELKAHGLPAGTAAIPLLKEAMNWIAEGAPADEPSAAPAPGTALVSVK